MEATNIFKTFFKSEKASGFILIACTILSMIAANTFFGDSYINFMHSVFLGKNIEFWVNDVLMSIFFLLIGLELEREIYEGELSNIKDAILPLFAAIGGMIVPAIVFLSLNLNNGFSNGFGIPMATDIAFAVGILSLLGKKVPLSMKVFLIALAIFDDLGAIIIIALVYSKTLVVSNIMIALGVYALLILFNRLTVHNILPYLIGGVVMWYFIYNSGIHPTITGVLLAFAIPFRKGNKPSCSNKLEKILHIPVAFFILPMFAIVNTAIKLEGNLLELALKPYVIGIIAGLVIGKPLGIYLFSRLGVWLKLASLPKGMKFKHIASIGMLAGIGFTMSIFITLLAFDIVSIQNEAKIAIIFASLVSGAIGYISLKNHKLEQIEQQQIKEDK